MALNDIKVPKENASGTFDEITLAASDLKLGTTANLPLKTGTSGVIEAGSFGTAAGSFCEGNDVRLSDDRDPNAHAASHLPDGADEIFDQSLNTTDSVTFLNLHIDGGDLTGVGQLAFDSGAGQSVTISEAEISFTGAAAATTLTNIGAAASGSITSSGLTQSTARILGRTTASTGAVEELAASDVRTFLNTDESTDTRDPNAHAASHAAAGSDPIEADDLASSNSPATDDLLVSNGDGTTRWDSVTNVVSPNLAASDIGGALSGDITTSGLTQATARILGRTTASTGAIEEITIGSGLSLSAGELSATGGSGGGEVRSDFVSPYTYTGLANAGTSESTASWLIRRSEFDAGGSFVATLTASAVQWANRLTASYA